MPFPPEIQQKIRQQIIDRLDAGVLEIHAVGARRRD
jgi:hypothetical protein